MKFSKGTLGANNPKPSAKAAGGKKGSTGGGKAGSEVRRGSEGAADKTAEHATRLREAIAKNPIGVKESAKAALASGNAGAIKQHLDSVKAKNASFERHKKGK